MAGLCGAKRYCHANLPNMLPHRAASGHPARAPDQPLDSSSSHGSTIPGDAETHGVVAGTTFNS